MLIAAIVAVCILLFALAFLLPRLSWFPQHGVDKMLSGSQRTVSRVPGRIGRYLAKPFSTSRRAADKSAGLGRRGRRHMPF